MTSADTALQSFHANLANGLASCFERVANLESRRGLTEGRRNPGWLLETSEDPAGINDDRWRAAMSDLGVRLDVLEQLDIRF